jgi:hypothetical protein
MKEEGGDCSVLCSRCWGPCDRRVGNDPFPVTSVTSGVCNRPGTSLHKGNLKSLQINLRPAWEDLGGWPESSGPTNRPQTWGSQATNGSVTG